MKLKVPVAVRGMVNNYEQYMRVYKSGGLPESGSAADMMQHIDQPRVRPYVFTDFDIDDAPEEVANAFINAAKREAMVRPMNESAERKWYRYEFESEIGHKYLAKVIREASKSSSMEAETIMEYLGNNNLRTSGVNSRYIDQILTVEPDYFRQFPNDNVVEFHFDIEQWSKGESFEQTRKNPLMSIHIDVVDENGIQSYYFDTPKPDDIDNEVPDDRQILSKFVEVFKKHDPDILVGYNHCGYDLQVICDRLQRHGFKTNFFDRDNQKEPFFRENKIGVNTLTVAYINGRVVYDVFHAVMADQTLNGQVKNRRLKTVAKYFQKKGVIPEDVDIVEEDMFDNRELCGTEELKAYNESDVRITRYLFNMYVKNNIAVAEFIGCPLAQVVPMATSYPFTIICAQIFHEQGIITNGKNADRNPRVFSCGGKPFQGADVACFKTGRYAPAFETDVASLYPSIIASLGLGPDNTRIVKTIDFAGDPPEPKTIRIGNKRIYHIPDTVRKWTWVIEVTGYSKVAEKIKEFLVERIKLKDMSSLMKAYTKAMKNGEDTTEFEAQLHELGRAELIGDMAECNRVQSEAYVRAYGLKVVLNSCYGLMGAAMNHYGEIAVATLITGIGRQVLAKGVEFLGEDTCILEDTDGIKTTNDCDIDEMNRVTSEWVEKELYGLPLIRWEKEDFKVIYSKAMKTYLLIDAKGNLVIHGVGFKSSRAPPVFDTIIKTLGRAMLEEGHEKTRGMAMRFYNLKNLEKKDFVMAVKLGKTIDSYNDSAIAKKIALAHQAEYGTPPAVGTVYEYVKTRHGYAPPTEANLDKLDMDYYRKVIDKAVKSLGYGNVFNTTLDEFF